MTTDDLTPADFDQRRRQLTEQIQEYAAGAKSGTLRRIRLGHAIACGHALAELKELLKHGDWVRWVEARCPFSRSTAHRYMRLASGANRVSPRMTIREGYIAAGVINPSIGQE
jgi:hypothetical protein